MLDWLKNFWRGSEVVEFESAFDLAESVDRLRAATKRSAFSAIAHQQAVGTVKVTRVSLRRVVPMVGNGFKPFFVGCFCEHGGKIVLRGRFRMSWFTKLFMAYWFGLLTLITAAMVAGGFVVGGFVSVRAWIGVAFVMGMLCFGLGLIRLGQWFSRNDPIWLSNVIGSALRTSPHAGSSTDEAQELTIVLPIHLMLFAGLIALGGVTLLVSGVSGVRSFHADLQDLTIMPFQGDLSRYLTAMGGILMLAWAYGIYRQHLVAWWAGSIFLACYLFDLVNTLVRPRTDIQPFLSSLPMTIVFTTVGFLALAIWGWWWYAQRVHFNQKPLCRGD